MTFNQQGGRAMLDIRAEVANALHWDIAIPRHRVTAEVDGGWVTLQGVVEWAYQRSLAEADARRVPGVTGVKNEIAVRAAEESSRQIIAKTGVGRPPRTTVKEEREHERH